MTKVWNVSPHPIVFDMAMRAVRPCDYVVVPASLAAQLLLCPDWGTENPRKRPVNRNSVKVEV